MTFAIPDSYEQQTGDSLLVVRHLPGPAMPAELVDELYELMITAYSEVRLESVLVYPCSREEWDAMVRSPRFGAIVVWVDGELAGMASTTDDFSLVPYVAPEFFAHRFPGRRLFYTVDVFVHPAHRARRVIHALFESANRFARLNNASMIFWTCDWDYQRHFVDLIGRIMAKDLNGPIRKIDTTHWFMYDVTDSDPYSGDDAGLAIEE